MQRLTALLALTLLLPASSQALAQDRSAHAPASAAETARVVKDFQAAARRSLGPRSGDLFALPGKYNYIIEGSYIRPVTSQVDMNGQTVEVQNHGNHHGTFWDYDVRIPLVLYGGGVRPGRYQGSATQQDIVPTVAHVLQTPPPEDAQGRVLREALRPGAPKPKIVVVLAFDQGGQSLFQHHPGATPYLTEFFQRGAQFTEARLTHLDPETIVGHVAIGTGAYPAQTGITANRPWFRQAGQARMAIAGETGPSPVNLESPTLADVWLHATKGQAVVIGQSLADRAAMGMIGHGAGYASSSKPIVSYYDDKRGVWTTNERYFTLPDYVRGMAITPYWKQVADASGKWRGYPIDNPTEFKISPAAARFDGDAMLAMLEREPVGEDEVPDLIFWSMKATDYTAHRYGQESLQTRETLTAQDEQVRRVIGHLERKVGRDRLLVAFTADHGGGPLAELAGGVRMAEADVLEPINARFDKLNNGVTLAQHVTSTQIFLNDTELAANGVTIDQVRDFVRTIQVGGKPFFAAVFTRADIERPAGGEKPSRPKP